MDGNSLHNLAQEAGMSVCWVVG